MRQVDQAAHEWLRQYGHYKNGILWRAGGQAEQPYRWMALMQMIEAEFGKIERERAAMKGQDPLSF